MRLTVLPQRVQFSGKLKQDLFIGIILSLVLNMALFGEEIPLDYMGQSFFSKNLDVEWKVETNALPAAVRVFEIEPGHFSQRAISNLMQLGGFPETNRLGKSWRGDKIPEDILCFGNSNGRHSLSIVPDSGTVDLYTPIFSTGLPEGVPDEEHSFTLATNILNQLEIPTGQLMTADGKLKAWFYPGEMTIYPKNAEPMTRRSQMGVEFRRLVDGFPCMSEYVRIDFEWWGKITKLEIRWHEIKPSKPYPVANLPTIANWIKEGRARVESISIAGPGGRRLNARGIKRIVVIGISLQYTASSQFSEKAGDDVAMKRLYPYAMLQADAEMNPDDHETIWLYCPISTGALSSISKKGEPFGFGIYPSKFEQKRMGFEGGH